MVIVDIRKQGGAAIMTIPSAILRLLGLEIGSKLELDVKNNTLIARASLPKVNKRLTLTQLLEGVNVKTIQELNDQTKWAREGMTQGQELG